MSVVMTKAPETEAASVQDAKTKSGQTFVLRRWLSAFDDFIGLELTSELKDLAVETTVRVTCWAIAAIGLIALPIEMVANGGRDRFALISALVFLVIGVLPLITHWVRKPYLGALALSLTSVGYLTWLAWISGGILSPAVLFLVLPLFWGWLFFSIRGSIPLILMVFGAIALLTVRSLDPAQAAQPTGFAGLSVPLSMGIGFALFVLVATLSGAVSWFNTRAHERDLIQSRDTALRANREKSEFIAGIAHEVRTPLTGLMGMLELLAKEELDANQREMAQTARASSRSILNLINDLLDLSKIEVGELRLVPEPADISDIFRTTANEFRQLAHQKGLCFDVSTPENSVWLLVDPTRFRQCISNYISNAVKFTERGKIHARLECTDLDNGEVRVRIAIEDTGPGIPAHLHRKVFARFVQVDGTQKSEHGGTGLGLAIVNDLAQLQGGSAWVESNEGRGSTFCFEAAYKRTSPLELPSGANVTEGVENATILIADDSIGNQRVLTRVLQSLGYRTLSAENGSDALMILLDHKVDLVLMDMNMPVKDGPTTLQDIRKLPDDRRHTPVVGLSADNSDSDMARWTSAGVDGFIAKPVDFATLDLTIRRVLGVQRQHMTLAETREATNNAAQ
jgi:signal transduction histidine kinase/CheY-like chemotaxis protein